MRGQREDGFTLIELMVSISILLVLAGLMMGGLKAAKDKSKRTRARAEVGQLVTAWSYYLTDYNKFPDVDIEMMDEVAVDILSGHHAAHNPKRVPYMDFHTESKGYRDPWGNFYQVKLDENLDGKVTVDGEVVRRSVAVWSMGSKSNATETADDVCSWKER
jgi:prepilin-type N-terminal cleavage/methylation domain-containing protein